MPRLMVLTMVTEESYEAVNAYMIGMYGDPPESVEIDMNAYIDGQNQAVATHSFGCANCSMSEGNALAAYVNSLDGCAAQTFDPTEEVDYWAWAGSNWNLKPVVPTP